jgi:lipid A 3-O-deacylase
MQDDVITQCNAANRRTGGKGPRIGTMTCVTQRDTPLFAAMLASNRAFRSIGVMALVIGCLWLWAGTGWAENFRLESAGVRGGLSAPHNGQQFNQAEVFVNWNLPWGWDLGKEWHLQSRLDLSAGWLGDRDNRATIGTVGPSLVLSRERLPVSLEGGVSPTFISRQDFGTKDFGTDVQFTSHLGLNWDFAAHWRLGYRFQHMSNANLAASNPGLNMHVFALSYRF